MDTKYQIFVSSTFIDLQEERRCVIEQVLNLGHIPIGMELFQAGDETQWSYIKRRIQESDYYILIIAERYGSEGNSGKSYTQMEYEFALKSKIPAIAFLLHSDAREAWPQSKIEFSKKDKIASFRKLCEKKLVRYWKNSDDLGTKVVTSLVELIKTRPRVGWVRADSVATVAALNEIARLSDEKRDMQARLEKYEEDNGLKVPAEIKFHIESLSNLKLDYLDSRNGKKKGKELPDKNALDVFIMLSPSLAIGTSLRDASYEIHRKLELDSENSVSGENVLAEYASRGLISVTYIQKNYADRVRSEKQFLLTENGSKVIMFSTLFKQTDN